MTVPTPSTEPTVLVLGAGASRAVSMAMPLTDDLSGEVQTLLRRENHRLRPSSKDGFNFETWLSFLSADLPWLSDAENLRNQALFLDASRHLGDVVLRHQNEALGEPMPSWLRTLVGHAAERQATVITFNYDTLWEKAYAVVEGNHPSQLRPVPVPSVDTRSGTVLGGKRPDRYFDLLKLHGSIDWCYSGSVEFFGETLYGLRLATEWKPDDPVSVRGQAVDKVPLIVPPTAGKSAFFRNEFVRTQWRLAYDRLREAKRIVIIGYSLPETDQMVRWMLTLAQSDPEKCREVVVVDRDCEVAARVLRLGFDERYFTAHGNIEEFVATLPGD